MATEETSSESDREAKKELRSIIPIDYYKLSSRKEEDPDARFMPLYVVLMRYFKPVVESANEEELKEIIWTTQPDLKNDQEVEKFYKWIKDKPTNEKIRTLIMRWYYP